MRKHRIRQSATIPPQDSDAALARCMGLSVQEAEKFLGRTLSKSQRAKKGWGKTLDSSSATERSALNPRDRKPLTLQDELTPLAGQDATLAHMLRMHRPLTLQTYLMMNWPGVQMHQLDAESLASIPEPLMRQALPDAPMRADFPTEEEFEEARGGWLSRVGRIKGLAGAKKTGA